MKKELPYHFLAVLCIIIWGAAGAATKTLLQGFTAIHVLFLKYMIGYLVLCILCPRPLRVRNKKDELLFFLCGVSGMTLCYLFENLAFVTASSGVVTVMFNLSPIMVVLAYMVTGKKHAGTQFWLGCAVCLAGAWLVAFNGFSVQGAAVSGVLLSLLAAAAWSVYILLVEKLGKGYEQKGSLRRMLFYAALTQLPLVLWEHKLPDAAYALQPKSLVLIFYFGVLSAAGGYLIWNFCIDRIGGAKTNMYNYFLPVFTMLISAAAIHEAVGTLQWVGAATTIAGVVLAQKDKELSSPEAEYTETVHRGYEPEYRPE